MTTIPFSARVEVWELRCRFNRGRYWQRQQAGEFTALVGKSNPARPAANQPPGTFSQEVYYLDRRTNVEVARVHQYVLSDGSIGASGRPDPKRLHINGVTYRMHRGQDVDQDPSLRFPVGPLRSGYILWRKLKCFTLGR